MRQKKPKRLTKLQLALLCEIAQEAHTIGRLYAHGGEKRLPDVEWERVRCMAVESERAGCIIPANESVRRNTQRRLGSVADQKSGGAA